MELISTLDQYLVEIKFSVYSGHSLFQTYETLQKTGFPHFE